MIKVKKKKLIILTSTISSAVVLGGLIGTSTYLANKDSGASKNGVEDNRGLQPILTNNLSKEQASTIDVQRDPEQQFVEVILDFIDVFDNKSIKNITLHIKKAELNNFNLSTEMPEDYILTGPDENKDPNSFSLQEGLNQIHIKEKPIRIETTLVFVLDREEKPEWTKTLISTSKRDIIKLEEHLPQGYRLKNTQDKAVVNLGQRNVFEIEKIIQEHKTTLNFINQKDQKIIRSEIVTTFDDQQISIQEMIPEGYILVETPTITIDKSNNILVREIITTLKFTLDGQIKETKTIKSKTLNEIIDANKLVPEGFHLINPEKGLKLNVDQEYTLAIAKNQVKHSTTLIFKDEEERKEFNVVVETFDDQVIPLESKIPSGYRLASSNLDAASKLQVDQKNIIYIEKIKTIVTFKDKSKDNNIIKTESIDYSGKYEPIKIGSLIPEGYRFINQQDSEKLVEQGNQYEIEVEPIIKKVSTTLIYKVGEQVIYQTTVITESDQPINAKEIFAKSQYANDYELSASESEKQVEQGKENTFTLVQKQKPDPQPVPTPKPEEPTPEPQPNPEDPTKDIQSQINRALSLKGSDVGPNENANMDFSLIKPTQPSSSTSVSKVVRGLVDNALNNLTELLNNLSDDKPNWAQIKKFVQNFKDIYELQVDINNKRDTLNEELAQMLLEHIASHPEDKAKFLESLRVAQAEKDEFYEKGMVPAFSVWPNEIGGNRFTFTDTKNNYVIQHMIKQNKSRVLASARVEQRTPGQIRNDEYYGWNKFDATEEFKKYGADKFDGITVNTYKPSNDNEYAKEQKLGEMNIITLDASKKAGYDKFIDVVNKIISENKPLNGITIKNIGKGSFDGDFTNLLKKLPKNIQVLSLYLQSFDATPLIGLKDKKIDELSISTSLNPLSDQWAMDPLSFGGVKHYSFDYVNNTINYTKSEEIPGSIIFNTMKFSAGSTTKDINDGFKLAFETKKALRIYQGAFGDGSWPTSLDFSLVPKITSLKDLNLYGRVFKRLTLNAAAGQKVFEVNLKDLNKQQWKSIIVSGPEKAKMQFKTTTGRNVDIDTYYIKGTLEDFDNNWNRELYGLFQASKDFLTTVYVDSQAVADVIKQSQAFGELRNATIKVKPKDFNPSSSSSGFKFE